MATPAEYIALSQSAYTGPNSADSPAGWTRIAESAVAPGNQGSANGYFGAAFRNDQTGAIVIANRGSRATLEGLRQDWGGSDVQILAQGNLGIPKAFDDATNFAARVRRANPDAEVTYTGHSLGGAEAQVQAAVANGKAVTFGAPGVAFAVDKGFAAAASGNVVNYVLPGDLVGMSGTHVGQTVMILPSGTTAIKDGVVLAVAAAVGGPLGLLAAALGLVGANHPLGNYAQALSSTSASASSSAGGGAGKPAARLTDMHVCPMVTGVVPHVGGPVVGPGAPNVLIGGLPAARVGDVAACVGPPDTVLMGSFKVFIGGQPAARMGDMTAHGGSIVIGMPTVLIA